MEKTFDQRLDDVRKVQESARAALDTMSGILGVAKSSLDAGIAETAAIRDDLLAIAEEPEPDPEWRAPTIALTEARDVGSNKYVFATPVDPLPEEYDLTGTFEIFGVDGGIGICVDAIGEGPDTERFRTAFWGGTRKLWHWAGRTTEPAFDGSVSVARSFRVSVRASMMDVHFDGQWMGAIDRSDYRGTVGLWFGNSGGRFADLAINGVPLTVEQAAPPVVEPDPADDPIEVDPGAPGDPPVIPNPVEGVQVVTQITDNGITVLFDRPVQAVKTLSGRWVVEQCEVVGYSPGWNGTENGAMIYPVPHRKQGFSKIYGATYDAAKRVDMPVVLMVGSHLLISKGGHPIVDAAGVTASKTWVDRVLSIYCSAAPTAYVGEALVAGYCGGDSELSPNLDEIIALLPAFPYPGGASTLTGAPTDASIVGWMANRLEHVWPFHVKGEHTGRATRPAGQMGAYHREQNAVCTDAMLCLLIDAPIEDRRRLLAVMLQHGIDGLSVINHPDAQGWVDAAINLMPCLLAQQVLGGPGINGFSDRAAYQVYAGTGARGQSPLWREKGGMEYEHTPVEQWVRPGSQLGGHKSEKYRRISSLSLAGRSAFFKLAGLAHLIPQVQHDYAERWMTEPTFYDPLGVENYGPASGSCASTLQRAFWDLTR